MKKPLNCRVGSRYVKKSYICRLCSIPCHCTIDSYIDENDEVRPNNCLLYDRGGHKWEQTK